MAQHGQEANTMASTFRYVSYLRTTPKKLWVALTDDVEPMQQYWVGTRCESEWTAGSSWTHVTADGQVLDAGQVVEVEPPRRLVVAGNTGTSRSSRPKGPHGA
jgi:uncharacterized protein YndB with AHSA1/START domain